jgi:hypothetical protein
MKRSTRRRPELEPLEPLVLLSASSRHAPKPAPVPPVVSLSGSVHATGKLSSRGLAVVGTGDLSPVGPVGLKYSANLLTPSLSVTLRSKHGKIILVGDSLLAPGTSSGSIHYRVIGGTGSYLGATGSGNASVEVGSLAGGKTTLDVTFS